MPQFNKYAAVPAMVAALSLTMTPAYAVELPQPAMSSAQSAGQAVFDPAEAQTYDQYRYRRYHHRRGPDAGDIIAGVLIIGAIAAVADAATRGSDDRRYRDRDYRDGADYRYPDTRRDDARWDDRSRDGRAWNDDRGIDRAVDMCIDEIERDQRVESVDRANRTARGWEIEGTVARGESFSCSIDEDGRIGNIDYGRRGASYEPQGDERYDGDHVQVPAHDDNDRQWDDDRYAAEWARVDRDGAAQPTVPPEDYSGDPAPADGGASVDGDLEVGTGYPGAGA